MNKNEKTLLESAELYKEAKKNGKIRFEKPYGNVTVIELDNWGGFAVQKDGEFVVPFGKYAFIDGFEYGLARVRSIGETTYHKNTLAIGTFDDRGEFSFIEGKELDDYYEKDFKTHREKYSYWGIINEDGEEVLPVEYDNIWKFYGKGRYSTRAEKGHEYKDIVLSELSPDAPSFHKHSYSYSVDEDYGGTYGEFAGSYAQDVMGYDDETINDAFEGDPDAYWNID